MRFPKTKIISVVIQTDNSYSFSTSTGFSNVKLYSVVVVLTSKYPCMMLASCFGSVTSTVNVTFVVIGMDARTEP